MRKVILYIAASVDGKIARADGSVDWLDEIQPPDGEDFGYGALMDRIDTTLMGRKTCQQVLSFDVPFPYSGLKNYVFTRKTDLQRHKEIDYVQTDPVDFVQKLKQQPGKDIWLIGGGQLNSLLLNSKVIDEIQLFVIPVVLGAGIPLFHAATQTRRLQLTSQKSFSNGVVELNYHI